MASEQSTPNTGSKRSGSVSRRTFIGTAGAAGVGLLAGCSNGGDGSSGSGGEGSSGGSGSSGSSGSGGTTTSSTEAITVAKVLPFSGSISSNGVRIEEGFELYVEEFNDGKLGGHPVDYIKRDTAAKTDKGVSVTRDALSQEPDFYLGPDLSSVAAAVAPQLEKKMKSTVWLDPTSSNNNLTADFCLPNHFRTGRTSYHAGHSMGVYNATNDLGRVALIYDDYVAGNQVKDAFTQSLTENGGEVVGETTVSLSTTDFSTQLNKLKQMDADAVFAFVLGSPSVSFVKQYAQFGLKDKMQLTGHAVIANTQSIEAEGDAALGLITENFYTPTKDTPRNNEFREAYQKATDKLPNSYSVGGFDCAQAADTAASKAGSLDTVKMINALGGAELDSPRGYFKYMAQTHDMIMDMDIRKVVGPNDKWDSNHSEVIHTYEKVKPPAFGGCDVREKL